MELRIFTCDVKGCNASHGEKKFNAGAPAWGVVFGLSDPATGADSAHLCPEHLNQVKKILNGGAD